MAKVKICGIRDDYTVRSAARAGAEWVGFVLVPESPRFIARDSYERVSDKLYDLLGTAAEHHVRSVVLLTDPDLDFLKGMTDAVLPDAIQLHGSESPDFVAQVREALPNYTEIWKAAGVECLSDLERLSNYEAADRLLIDAKAPEGADRSGGHGQTFDWSIMERWDAPKPWLLAGGLTPENVAGAIAATGADAVDVSSGVERERGVKDSDLIKKFIDAAKAA
ncbi:phosphoribosylanthranilate isomerase [Henriciella sp. AS95]|uniref:phosphoribosylanthranilate isomerase n=1 Tax=Henriciella sp. AS95 TaxID=3135782 RepID=UPI00317E5C81